MDSVQKSIKGINVKMNHNNRFRGKPLRSNSNYKPTLSNKVKAQDALNGDNQTVRFDITDNGKRKGSYRSLFYVKSLMNLI